MRGRGTIHGIAGARRSYAERFWEKVRIGAQDECWLWLGAGNGSPYGVFAFRAFTKRCEKAHRAAWVLANGAIPPGFVVMHKCDNGKCVNPAHLILGTQSDNVQDMLSKGRFNVGDRRARWTHCKNGHLFTPETTYIAPKKTRRECLICRRQRTKDWQAAHRGPWRNKLNAVGKN